MNYLNAIIPSLLLSTSAFAAAPRFVVFEDKFNSMDQCNEFQGKIEEKIKNAVSFCAMGNLKFSTKNKESEYYSIVAVLKENQKNPVSQEEVDASIRHISVQFTYEIASNIYDPTLDKIISTTNIVTGEKPVTTQIRMENQIDCEARRLEDDKLVQKLIYSRCIFKNNSATDTKKGDWKIHIVREA